MKIKAKELITKFNTNSSALVKKISIHLMKFLLIYRKNDNLLLFTDDFGNIPIFYGNKDGQFIISSSLNVIKSVSKIINITDINILDPKSYIIFNIIKTEISVVKKEHHSFIKKHDLNQKQGKRAIDGLIQNIEYITKKSITNKTSGYKKVGLLYSGGIDSSITAQILKINEIPFTAYTVGSKDSHDVNAAEYGAKFLNFPLKKVIISEEDITKNLYHLEEIINSYYFSMIAEGVPPVVTFEIAFTYFFAMKEMHRDRMEAVISGIGTEELFIGFSLEERHGNLSKPLDQISYDKFMSLYKRDIYKDYILAEYFNLDLIYPYLDRELAELVIPIPVEMKIKDGLKKYIWRLFGKSIGLSDEIAFRTNKATQYGSKTSQILLKVAKAQGYKYKKEIFKKITESVYSSSSKI